MKDNLSRYTLRIDQTLLDKLGYIAEYEGRTKNRELEQMIKQRQDPAHRAQPLHSRPAVQPQDLPGRDYLPTGNAR